MSKKRIRNKLKSRITLHKRDTPMEPVEGVIRIVVCAANRYGDIIIPSARHFDVTMRNTFTLLSRSTRKRIQAAVEEQGFIDQWGNFLTRKEALAIAKANGQYGHWREPCHHQSDLFSEDLY